MYFPEYGWIQFEPTAAEDPLVRPGSPEEASQQLAREQQRTENADEDILRPDKDERNRDAVPPTPEPDAAAAAAVSDPPLPLWPLALLVAVSLAVATVYQVVWHRPLAALSHAEGAFWRLSRVASWLGQRRRPSETPHEFGRRLQGVVGDGEREIDTIVGAYVHERFAGRPQPWPREALLTAWQALHRPFAKAAARLGLSRVTPKPRAKQWSRGYREGEGRTRDPKGEG